MDTARLDFLCSPHGQELLARLGRDPLTPTAIFKFRQRYPGAELAAITELLDLRQHARSKFAHADQMYFDRTGLEQASSGLTANYHASRFGKFRRVADLCCGIGSDALALANLDHEIIAVDIDLLRLRLTDLNARAFQLRQHLQPVRADVTRWVPGVDAFFIDPDRRQAGRRTVSLQQMHPSIEILPFLRQTSPHIGMKISAAVNWRDIPADCEFEVVSVDGQCREALLWFGDLKSSAHRATILPGGHSFATNQPDIQAPTHPPGEFLYDPDPAISRAQLVDALALDLNAWKIDPMSPLLSSHQKIDSPFVSAYRIVEQLPYQPKKLKQWLHQKNAGEVTIAKRGLKANIEALQRQLKTRGDVPIVLFISPIDDKAQVLQIERL